MFDSRWRSTVDQGVAPVGSHLGARRLKPDHLTTLGLVLAVATAVVIGSGHLLWGLILLIASAVPDLLDGAVAKAAGLSSVRGAFFDSVADRVSDALVLGGVAWYLASVDGSHAALLPFAVLGTSTLISYERAKAEALGFQAKGGLMERAERVIALCLGLAFPVLLVPVLLVMLALTSMTAIQRFIKVWRQAPGPGESTIAPRPPLGERWAARHDTGTSRWREWREATTLKVNRPDSAPNRWRSDRRGPDRVGRTGLDRSWRPRDRSRP